MAPWMMRLESGNKQIMAGTYMGRELTDLIEERIKLTQFDKQPRVKRTNKLAGIAQMVLSLDELDNTDNLEYENLSNVLLSYHVTGSEEVMCLEPVSPQYKRLRNRGVHFHNPVNNGPKWWDCQLYA